MAESEADNTRPAGANPPTSTPEPRPRIGDSRPAPQVGDRRPAPQGLAQDDQGDGTAKKRRRRRGGRGRGRGTGAASGGGQQTLAKGAFDVGEQAAFVGDLLEQGRSDADALAQLGFVRSWIGFGRALQLGRTGWLG